MTPHPSKEGREPLTRDKILDKAIEILDEQGVQGLSMRHLGDALGVEAMSLYHHFPNKDAILDGVVDRIVQETGPGLPISEASSDWKAVMRSGPASAERAISAHPNAAYLFLGRQYSTPESLPMLEAPLRILYEAGFRDQELVDAAHAIFAYAAGWLFLSGGQGGSFSAPLDEAVAHAPQVAPLAAEFAPQLRDWSNGFDEGFTALMDGLEARMKPTPE